MANPYDQFDAPPATAEATAPAAGPSPYDQFDPTPAAAPAAPIGIAGPDGNPDALLQHPMPSATLALMRGIRDPLDGGAQLLARSLLAISPAGGAVETWAKGQLKSTEDANAAAEADYQKRQYGDQPPSVDAGRMVGNAVGTIPLSMAAPELAGGGALARIALGAGLGAANGAVQPVAGSPGTGDYWLDKLKQVGLGTATGGVMSGAGELLAKAIQPNVNPAVQTLIDNGVTPTPGQIMGGAGNRIEEAAQNIPVVGDAIRAARGRSIDDFNRSAIDQALAPIGEKLDAATPLGHEAITEAATKISNNYDNLLPQLTAKVDPEFKQAVGQLVSNAQFMPPDRLAQFKKIFDGQVLSKFSPSGTMTGESFKDVESSLGQLASGYRNSTSTDERQLGGALLELQAQLRGLLTRSNPAKAADLQAANTAYANLLRVQGAGARIGADEGTFTPAQLLSSVRQLDPTLRKSAFAKGNALMQDYAEAGKSVLGNKVPDSGTAERAVKLGVGGGALAGLFNFSPAAAIGSGALGAATMGAYTPTMQGLLAKMMTVRPAGAGAVANAVRGGAPGGSAMAAGLLARLAGQ